jgi:hypothetical protein
MTTAICGQILVVIQKIMSRRDPLFNVAVVTGTNHFKVTMGYCGCTIRVDAVSSSDVLNTTFQLITDTEDERQWPWFHMLFFHKLNEEKCAQLTLVSQDYERVGLSVPQGVVQGTVDDAHHLNADFYLDIFVPDAVRSPSEAVCSPATEDETASLKQWAKDELQRIQEGKEGKQNVQWLPRLVVAPVLEKELAKQK